MTKERFTITHINDGSTSFTGSDYECVEWAIANDRGSYSSYINDDNDFVVKVKWYANDRGHEYTEFDSIEACFEFIFAALGKEGNFIIQ